ncbi:phage tail length tape measure family protein [Rugamonas aquatica]|uniref:Bacteriophage tail tape measure N-terminal domain-containing protein n=1 Tax=Rugamonas aquatica TaxID=2743357 RepID=A0A6A7N2H4_9BURK|nr:phage tail length tape measure family protein [Rugamonas aquatica]MQA39038.1 hypothetical protein [Rugamonas aquatica]
MTDTISAGVIEMSVGTSGVDAGLAHIDGGVARTGRNLANLGQQGTAALDSIGAGGASAAARVDNTTRSLIGSVERATAALEAGKKSGADYFETLARNRGADLTQLAPFIAQLREVEAAQVRAASAANETRIAQEAAAEAARAESLAQREAAHALAGRDNFLAGLREQIALYGRSSEEVLRYRAAQAGIAHDADPLIDQLHDLRTAHEQVAVAARAEAQAQREAAQVQTNQNSFVASLEQQANAIGRTRSQLLEMQAAQLGVTNQAAPFIARLREAEGGLGRTGASAAQTAAALRGVPAQFTDIVTSIQGGQAPLTVFLQQGGQLRDMFGGAGPAARALGGYIVGLINPFTLAAAGAAALAIAYHEGSKEAEAYNRALIMTGNAAGGTANQLADAARNIGKVAGSQHEASSAVAELAATGKVAAASLQRFGLEAVASQHALGKSISDTVEEFASLGRDPVAALAKLNEKYHFITASTYAQVKALKDQGKATEAAQVAQDAFANGLNGQREKVLATLTDWERGWLKIKKAALGVVDGTIDLALGREATNSQKINALLAERELIEKRIGVAVQKGDSDKEKGFRADLDRNKQQINGLRAKTDADRAAAAAEAASAAAGEARIKWLDEGDKYLSRGAQLERDITRAKNDGIAAGVSQADIEKRIGEIRKNYADIYNDQIDAQIEKIKQRAAIEQEVDKRTGLSLAAARATGLASSYDLDIQYAEKVAALDQAALARDRKGLLDEIELTKQKINSKKAIQVLNDQIKLLDEKSLTRKAELEKQIADLDTKNTRQSASDLADLADKRVSDRDALLAQMQAQENANSLIGASKEQINAFNKALVNESATRLESRAAIIGGNEARKEEADAMIASAAAMRSLAQAQADGLLKTERFDQQKKLWESIDQTAHDTFVNIFDNGKNAFDRLRDTLKAGLLDLLYQMTVKKWIFSIGAQVTGFSGLAGAAQASSITGGLPGPGGAISLLQTAKGAYDAISNGFAGISNSVAEGVQSGINMLGPNSGFYSSAGSGMPLSSPASAAGTAAQYLAGAAAGKMLGSAISGQYGIGDHGSAVVNIATVTGSLFGGPIGGAIGGAIGGLLNRAFGMGSKDITAQGINGSLGNSGFTGQTFQTWHQDGGWFRSDKNGTDNTPVDTATAKSLGDAYAGIKKASTGFAEALGIDATSIQNRTQSLNIALTSDAAENQKAISDFFVGVGDTIAKELVPGLAAFSASGETASTTLQRIAGDFSGVEAILTTIGRTSETAFGAVGLASVEARERLIAAAGSLDSLSSGTAYFAQNFLSPAEQMAPIIANVKKQLADLGGASVTTNDDFKQLVLSLVDSGKLATDAGAKQYAALLQLAPQVKQVTDYMGTLNGVLAEGSAVLSERADLQKRYDQATLSSDQLQAQQRAALDPSNRGLFDRVQAAEAAKSASDALKSVNAGYQQQIDEFIKSTMSVTEVRALEIRGMDDSTVALYDRLAGLKAESLAQQAAAAAIQKARDSATTGLQALGNALVDSMKNAEAAGKSLNDFAQSLLLGDLSALNPEDRYKEAKRQLLSSDLGDTAAATAFLNASKARDAGDFSYSRDFALVQSRLASAASAQFSLAASIPATWAQMSQFYREQMAPGFSSPAQNLVAASTSSTANSGSVEDALMKMGEKVVAALAPIATNTEKAASVLDLVTEGGSAMLVTS